MVGRKLMAAAVLAALGIGGCNTSESRRDRSLIAAEAALAAGDLERATELLRAARGFDPRDRQVAMRLAQVYEQSHADRQALRLMTTLPEKVHDPQWLNLRARLLLRCGRLVDGAHLAAALGARDEADEATFQTLSDLVVERHLGVEVIGDLPDIWILRLAERLLDVGEPAEALSWLERHDAAADPFRDRLVEELAETALELHDRGLVRRVETLLASPGSPVGLLLRRRLLMLAGKAAEVARLDARFLTGFPDHPRRGELLEAEARRHLARAEAERALKLADEALTLDGSSVPALIVRGLALESSGRTEAGHAALRAALAIDPENGVAREALRSSQKTAETILMRIESLQR